MTMMNIGDGKIYSDSDGAMATPVGNLRRNKTADNKYSQQPLKCTETSIQLSIFLTNQLPTYQQYQNLSAVPIVSIKDSATSIQLLIFLTTVTCSQSVNCHIFTLCIIADLPNSMRLLTVTYSLRQIKTYNVRHCSLYSVAISKTQVFSAIIYYTGTCRVHSHFPGKPGLAVGPLEALYFKFVFFLQLLSAGCCF